jgi:hypothetical protein
VIEGGRLRGELYMIYKEGVPGPREMGRKILLCTTYSLGYMPLIYLSMLSHSVLPVDKR